MEHRFKKVIMLLFMLSWLLLTACGKGKPVDTTGPSDVTTAPQEQEETQITDPSETETASLMPWEAESAKQPEDYTMEEYEKLTSEQKKAFQDFLGKNGYAAWLEQIEQATEVTENSEASENSEEKTEDNPWDKPNAKQPIDYTWEEYESLSEGQKKAFMENLGPNKLEAWLRKVQDQKEKNPWDAVGAKQPKNYTWGEYQALSNKQKTAFANYLGTSGFQTWLKKNQSQNVVSQNPQGVYPWDKLGAKRPEEYSWEEYENLTSAQQKAFQNYLGSSGFEVWKESAQEKKNPWEESGTKQPENYTWEEYTALTENQKTAFQEYLGARGYEDWLKNTHQQEEYPWDKDGAKQAQDYTWNDYETLSETQQVAFQDHLGIDGFDAWLKKIADIPWDKPDFKQPEDYTMQEYTALTKAQKLAFYRHMGTDNFDTWFATAQKPKEENPWEKPGAKQPEEYTWEEFEILTADQQMAFQKNLGTEEFEAWLNRVQSQPEINPWDEPGAKQPVDYSWEEYEALTAAQQMAFQKNLGAEEFEEWLNRVQIQPEPEKKYPWDEPGAKQPADYTWEKYEALTAAQQMAFQSNLGTKGFEEWLNRVQSQPQPEEKYPWDAAGAKQPADYTWEEFEALTAAQQMAFQNDLGVEEFEAWLNRAQSQPEINPWDEPGAKQPVDYTWAEFEALTAAQQMAFQKYLGEGGFEEWLNRVQSQPEINPWDEPGAKQPVDYTWEEFEDLTAAQQIAFQNDLGVEEFEAWLNRVLTEENS